MKVLQRDIGPRRAVPSGSDRLRHVSAGVSAAGSCDTVAHLVWAWAGATRASASDQGKGVGRMRPYRSG